MDHQLKYELSGRQIVIWGARIVGIGLQRSCLVNNISVIGFIDSDPALQERIINGSRVMKPEEIPNLCNDHGKDKITIVIAVSIKEQEIYSQLISIMPEVNYNLVNYSDYQKDFYTIDIVGTCNLKCASCAHSIPNHGVPMGIMRYEEVKAVIKKIKRESPGSTHVSLYSWGEPLIHPELQKIIEAFHENGIAVGISTNLSHEKTEKIDSLIKSAPDYLKISISGYYPEAYNTTHQGGDITLVKSNLYRLRFMLDKSRADTLVDINYHLYRNNNGKNLESMQRLAKELNFSLSTVHALVMPLERVLNYCKGKGDEQTRILENNLLVTIKEGIRASSTVEINDKCPFRENQININADLTVPVCCTVFERDFIVAKNYLKTKLCDINKRKSSAEICKECLKLSLPQYNMGFNKPMWDKIAGEKLSKDSLS